MTRKQIFWLLVCTLIVAAGLVANARAPYVTTYTRYQLGIAVLLPGALVFLGVMAWLARRAGRDETQEP